MLEYGLFEKFVAGVAGGCGSANVVVIVGGGGGLEGEGGGWAGKRVWGQRGEGGRRDEGQVSPAAIVDDDRGSGGQKINFTGVQASVAGFLLPLHCLPVFCQAFHAAAAGFLSSILFSLGTNISSSFSPIYFWDFEVLRKLYFCVFPAIFSAIFRQPEQPALAAPTADLSSLALHPAMAKQKKTKLETEKAGQPAKITSLPNTAPDSAMAASEPTGITQATHLGRWPVFYLRWPLLLKNMLDYFEFKEDDINITPVWAIFPSLPFECWHPNALGKIGSRLGTPIAMDSLTMSMERVSYARILVEVDASKKLVDQVESVLPNGTTRTQLVVYEFTPKFCSECHHFVHLNDSCKGIQPPAATATTTAAATVKTVVPKKLQDSEWTLVHRRNKNQKHIQQQYQQKISPATGSDEQDRQDRCSNKCASLQRILRCKPSLVRPGRKRFQSAKG
ncbi:hypothetical protein Salat_1151500 [Sesamum alatum]|uniref:DUF4283 domain-containing protein n=1 Tax=Sesamum alatum TaxID=300844 RepID=A0AAE1YFB7_9LAMI|nr:hypothetical protein Salat_1151500 [Sesamum alatum]